MLVCAGDAHGDGDEVRTAACELGRQATIAGLAHAAGTAGPDRSLRVRRRHGGPEGPGEPGHRGPSGALVAVAGPRRPRARAHAQRLGGEVRERRARAGGAGRRADARRPAADRIRAAGALCPRRRRTHPRPRPPQRRVRGRAQPGRDPLGPGRPVPVTRGGRVEEDRAPGVDRLRCGRHRQRGGARTPGNRTGAAARLPERLGCRRAAAVRGRADRRVRRAARLGPERGRRRLARTGGLAGGAGTPAGGVVAVGRPRPDGEGPRAHGPRDRSQRLCAGRRPLPRACAGRDRSAPGRRRVAPQDPRGPRGRASGRRDERRRRRIARPRRPGTGGGGLGGRIRRRPRLAPGRYGDG